MTWERACRRVVAALAVALLLPALPAAAEAPPVEPEVRSVTTRWSGPLFIGLATLGLTNPLDSPADFTFALAGPAGWTWDVIEGRGDRTVEGVTAYEAWSATLLLSADLPLAGPARFAVRVNDGPAADIILPVDPRPAVAVLGPPCVAVVPGEAADLLFTVVNEGNAADPFTLAVASGRPDVSAALAGGPVSKPVGPDQPLPVVVRAVAGAGATVDPDVQIVLTATSGTDPTVVGRASACLAIAAAPELHLAVTPAEAVITPGETVLLAIDLLNRGNAPDSVRLGVRGLPAGWLASPGTDAVDLSPFSAGRSDIALRVPPGTPPQDVVLTVEGTSELGAAADDLLRVRVAPVRGLTILPEASLPVPPGGTARVPVTLINTGTLPETVLVVVAPPATWGPPSQMLVAVPAGGTVGTAVVVDIPGDYRIARAGAHTVALTASGLTGGAGASTATVIEVAAVHRLTAALPGAGVAVNPALTPETTVLLELANDGNGPEEVALTVSDGPADAVRLYQSFVPLQPGERRQVPIGLHLSPAVPPGILLVRIDAATDAVRLSLDLPVTVLDGDLAVRSFGLRTAGGPVYDTLPVAADRRDLVEVLLLVRNEGTAVIAGGVAEIEAGGTPIRRQELGPMAPGESVLLQFPWRPPPGTTELTAVVQAPGDSHPEDDTARASAAAAAPPPSAAPTVATGAVVGGLLLLWLAVAGNEAWKIKLLAALVVPLYTRIRKEEVLDNFLRGRVYGYVEANPGEHFTAIRQALGVANGALAYHLAVLEREGYLVSEPDRQLRRFFPKRMREEQRDLHSALRFRMARIQEIILERVRVTPGIGLRELARALQVNLSTVHYHSRILVGAGILVSERQLGRTRLFVAPAQDEPAGAVGG